MHVCISMPGNIVIRYTTIFHLLYGERVHVLRKLAKHTEPRRRIGALRMESLLNQSTQSRSQRSPTKRTHFQPPHWRTRKSLHPWQTESFGVKSKKRRRSKYDGAATTAVADDGLQFTAAQNDFEGEERHVAVAAYGSSFRGGRAELFVQHEGRRAIFFLVSGRPLIPTTPLFLSSAFSSSSSSFFFFFFFFLSSNSSGGVRSSQRLL